MYSNAGVNASSVSLSDDENETSVIAPTKEESWPEVINYPNDVGPAEWSLHSSNQRRRLERAPQNMRAPVNSLPPEILITILKQLQVTRDLHSALLVCRAWCQCVVELLWHRPSFPDTTHFVQLLTSICSEEQTFNYAHFIRRLNFLTIGPELTDALFMRLDQCIKLERLTLINCSEISDEALLRVFPACKNLVSVDLTNVSNTTDRSIIALAQAAKRLQGINLGGCKNVTDEGVLAIAQNCPLLRRLKLSGLKEITDTAVSKVAVSCPLLLEIDLNQCPNITNTAVRDLWTNLNHLREIRLSHCELLTDLAFPSSRAAQARPVPPTIDFAPLVLMRSYEHLRMLDLGACEAVTDDAIEGIVSAAPRIRNLVLARCSLITDTGVESICKLGKHLHYLHLAHASSITDRSIKTLARSCTRLRYIDLACCPRLTDMSVFELSSLAKLRRIGLVRVVNLTDQAIYALADRHLTLERIHLSYCEHITILAIHFLLQRLHKLTHLSLTGVPAFQRPEFQAFCRPPPKEYNATQRASFCVYSGKGVDALRQFLASLMRSVHGSADVDDNETDYEDGQESPQIYTEEELDREQDPEPDDETMSGGTISRGVFRGPIVRQPAIHRTIPIPQVTDSSSSHFAVLTPVLSGATLTQINTRRSHTPIGQDVNMTPTIGNSRVFGQELLVEPTSPPFFNNNLPPVYATSNASDVASNRSTGTTGNGAGFFKTYFQQQQQQQQDQDERVSRGGALTPDLIYAEIGHGRGRALGTTAGMSNWTGMGIISTSSSHDTATQANVQEVQQEELDRMVVLADSSRHFYRNNSSSSPAVSNEVPGAGWPIHDMSTCNTPAPQPPFSASPTTRELHASVYSALTSSVPSTSASASRSGLVQERKLGSSGSSSSHIHSSAVGSDEHAARGRSVRRTFRNTLNAAEQYATSFFRRGSSSHAPRDPSAGPSTG